MSGEVPSGWSVLDLADHTILLPGFAFKSDDFGLGADDRVPLVRIRDLVAHNPDIHVQVGFDARFAVKNGDFLVGMDGEFIATRWRGGPAALNQRVMKIEGRQPWIDTDFLFYRLQPELKKLESSISGTTVKHLSAKHIRELALAIPPLPEQRRIAEILSSVDEAIRTTQAVIDQTRKVKQGVLERLLTKGIGHTRFKQTEIGEIPESWECRSVRSLLSSSTYGVNVPLETSQASGIPVLRMGNIQDSEIDLSNLKYATLSEQDAQRYDIRSGDILFNRTNSRELVGKVAVARHDISATFASYLIRLRCSSGTDPFWLHAVLSSPKYQDILRSVATPGASQANINANKLGDILVPVPPSEEQKTISGFNDQFRAAEEANCFERQRLEGIKSALMADLLTGRKRVSTALSAAAE